MIPNQPVPSMMSGTQGGMPQMHMCPLCGSPIPQPNTGMGGPQLPSPAMAGMPAAPVDPMSELLAALSGGGQKPY